jgi:hypothetical protein
MDRLRKLVRFDALPCPPGPGVKRRQRATFPSIPTSPGAPPAGQESRMKALPHYDPTDAHYRPPSRVLVTGSVTTPTTSKSPRR